MEKVLAQRGFSVKMTINGQTLTFALVPDKPLKQNYIRDKKTYNADFTKTPLTITPRLGVSGKEGDQSANLSNLNWALTNEKGAKATQTLTAVSGSQSQKLAANLTDCTSLLISCTAVYTDPISKLKSDVTATLTISKEEVVGANISAIIFPKDNNGGIIDNTHRTATLQATLQRGGEDDITDVSYQWYQLRSGAWVKLDSSNAQGISGYTTRDLTIPASAIVNVGVFKCVIKDTDSGSGTYNKEAAAIYTVIDQTDPYEIDIFQPQGDSVAEGGTLPHWFKIRQGATYITESVFLNAHDMKVWRYSANSVLDTTWGTSGYKTCTKNVEQARYELNIEYKDLLAPSQAFCVELR